MSIRLRLRIALILAAIVPALVGGVWSLYTLHRTGALAIDHSEKALTEAGETAILAAADTTARQIELYIDMHSEIDLTDAAELESDATLAQIAVQTVGQTGYTAVFDEGGITHFHLNPAIVGMDMSTLADELPEFWAIMEASLDGSPSAGYYDWEDADGQIRAKYMSIAPVKGTNLRVAATTYIDEFSYPIFETRSELANTQKTARIQLILALLGVGALAVIGASYFSQLISRPIGHLRDAATRVTAGDLSPLGLPERRDEIGVLSHAFETMIAQLNELVTSLETRSAELSQRTQELEQSNRQYERQAAQLEASAKIARAVASLLDPEQLLTQVVHLISDAFGHYHTGVFLRNG
jgi:methyl-accepting chemotaxis protein